MWPILSAWHSSQPGATWGRARHTFFTLLVGLLCHPEIEEVAIRANWAWGCGGLCKAELQLEIECESASLQAVPGRRLLLKTLTDLSYSIKLPSFSAFWNQSPDTFLTQLGSLLWGWHDIFTTASWLHLLVPLWISLASDHCRSLTYLRWSQEAIASFLVPINWVLCRPESFRNHTLKTRLNSNPEFC